MNHNQNTGWLLGVFTFVALFAGSSLFIAGEAGAQPEAVQFSALTNADIDMIIAVKAEMQAAKVQAN